MTNSCPFYLVSAFTNDAYGGNPAAVVFLKSDIPTAELLKITANFNQPIVSFITATLPSTNEEVASFTIRWFTPHLEVPLCGHGTLAAAKAILTEPGLVSDNVKVIEFHTTAGVIVKAIKGDGEWFEIQLPANIVEEVSPDEKIRISALVAQAVGKPDVVVRNVLKGEKGLEYAMLIELDEKENLGTIEVDASKLLTTGWVINVLTTRCTDGSALFVSRMFAPHHLISSGGEDHVCGSAHCMLAPYWSRKLQVTQNSEMRAKQVSKRGGDLKVIVDGQA